MSAEVVDSNPYSRLVALERMGVVQDYERIRDKAVAVVGCGGVGSVVAEMLTRCGVGKLLLYDYDKVELCNMNRLFYRPEQAGMTKVAAAAETLHSINPDVAFLEGSYNIAASDCYERLVTELTTGGMTPTLSAAAAAADDATSANDGTAQRGRPVDLLLCCVDNFAARLVVNRVCLEHGLVWMESGVAENAVSGHTQLMLPGVTPCYECAPPLVVATGQAEAKREGVCAASLPTTMGIIAGLLSQNALKYLLGFGKVTQYVGYDALNDHFPDAALLPNPECNSNPCRAAQAKHQRRIETEFGGDAAKAHPLHNDVERAKGKDVEDGAVVAAKAAQRASNAAKWGISVASSGDKASSLRVDPTADPASPPTVASAPATKKGSVEYAFAKGAEHDDASADGASGGVPAQPAKSSESLDSLMARLRQVSQ